MSDSVWPQSAEIYVYESRTGEWMGRVCVRNLICTVGPFVDLSSVLSAAETAIGQKIAMFERTTLSEPDEAKRLSWRRGSFVPPTAVKPC